MSKPKTAYKCPKWPSTLLISIQQRSFHVDSQARHRYQQRPSWMREHGHGQSKSSDTPVSVAGRSPKRQRPLSTGVNIQTDTFNITSMWRIGATCHFIFTDRFSKRLSSYFKYTRILYSHIHTFYTLI